MTKNSVDPITEREAFAAVAPGLVFGIQEGWDSGDSFSVTVLAVRDGEARVSSLYRSWSRRKPVELIAGLLLDARWTPGELRSMRKRLQCQQAA